MRKNKDFHNIVARGFCFILTCFQFHFIIPSDVYTIYDYIAQRQSHPHQFFMHSASFLLIIEILAFSLSLILYRQPSFLLEIYLSLSLVLSWKILHW